MNSQFNSNSTSTSSSTPEELVKRWLDSYPVTKQYKNFKWVPLSEQKVKRQEVIDNFGKTVFLHHNDPSEFSDIVAALGYKEAAKQFDKRPKDDKTRKANFGEILASEYLRQEEGYDIPVYRLRWNTNPDTSMRGEDVLAFKFGLPNGQEREMCIAESKVSNTFNSRTVKEACSQLTIGKRPRPNSIPFIYSVLKLQGELTKAKQILQFSNRTTLPAPNQTYFLLLVTGNKPLDPFSVLSSIRVPRNLTAASLYVKNLGSLVTRLFNTSSQI